MILTNKRKGSIMYQPVKKIEDHEDISFPLSIYKLSHKIGLLPHYHDNFEIIYIKKGELTISIGQNSYHAKEGSIYFPNTYQVHSTNSIAGKKCIFYAIVFDGRILDMINTNSYYSYFIRPFIDGSIRLPESISQENSIYPELKDSVDMMIKEYYSKKLAYEIYLTTSIERIFASLIRLRSLDNNTIDNKFSFTYKKLLDDLMKYIEKRYTDEITLDDISSYLNINKYYFCRVIKKLTGKSFIQLLNMYRVKQAEMLLKDPMITVYEIAERSGFRNLSYFNRIFLRYTGSIPSKSRK